MEMVRNKNDDAARAQLARHFHSHTSLAPPQTL